MNSNNENIKDCLFDIYHLVINSTYNQASHSPNRKMHEIIFGRTLEYSIANRIIAPISTI